MVKPQDREKRCYMGTKGILTMKSLQQNEFVPEPQFRPV